jgi:NitT/TauT family transport system substrate-binding protein
MVECGMNKIKIAHWGGRHIIYLPFNVADRLGFFKELGLDVSILHVGNDNDIYAEVAQGRAQFGIGDPSFVALGYHQGHDTRIVGTIAGSVGCWGLTHHGEIQPLTQISDFSSLRVGTFPKPSTVYTLLSALKARQPRLLKSMQIVETEIGQQAYLLASDQVDLILEIEPMVALAQRQGLRVVCSMSDFFPDLLFTGLMTSAAFIAQSPDIVGKVVKGLQRGLDVCRKQPEKAIAVGVEMFPTISTGVMTEAVQRMTASRVWPEQAVISPSAWINALKMRQDVGELDSLPPFEAVIDQRFAYAALEGS